MCYERNLVRAPLIFNHKAEQSILEALLNLSKFFNRSWQSEMSRRLLFTRTTWAVNTRNKFMYLYVVIVPPNPYDYEYQICFNPARGGGAQRIAQAWNASAKTAISQADGLKGSLFSTVPGRCFTNHTQQIFIGKAASRPCVSLCKNRGWTVKK